jgi:hypothetical protein
LEEIARQIAELEFRANSWLNFSIACGWIALALSVTAFAYLLISDYQIRHKPKHERRK